VVAAALVVAAGASPTIAVAEDQPVRRGLDFNGDGFGDLVVGAPLDDLAIGVRNDILPGQMFVTVGSVAVPADTDGDGFPDLLVGVPGKSAAATRAGAVHVLRGGGSGVLPADDQEWNQALEGVHGLAEPEDQWGRVLGSH